MRTERSSRVRSLDSNALASSIVLACRPRPAGAAGIDRRGVLRALRDDLPAPIRDMQKAAVAPVDLRQAAIGPGMAVFSRYARVVESNGDPMRVHTALGLINQVLEAVVSEAEAELDPETRWAIAWYAQHFEDEGPYGIAEQLAVQAPPTTSRPRTPNLRPLGPRYPGRAPLGLHIGRNAFLRGRRKPSLRKPSLARCH